MSYGTQSDTIQTSFILPRRSEKGHLKEVFVPVPPSRYGAAAIFNLELGRTKPTTMTPRSLFSVRNNAAGPQRRHLKGLRALQGRSAMPSTAWRSTIQARYTFTELQSGSKADKQSPANFIPGEGFGKHGCCDFD